MLSECWVIRKIRVRFAAGAAPVAVKRRAVNASILLKKNTLYTRMYTEGESRVQIADWCAPRKIANVAENLVL
jgi:hypothetical protein